MLFSTIGTASYYGSLAINSAKVANGDSNAIGNIVNDTTDEIVGDVEFSVGSYLVVEVLAIIGGLGVTFAAALAVALRKVC